MSCRTSDQTTEHVATAFIGWHNTIRDHERYRTHMVCDYTQRYVCAFIISIRYSCDLTYLVTQCF